MVTDRLHSRRRALVALGIASVVLFAACGGGKSKSENPPAPSAPNDKKSSGVATETTVAKAQCNAKPGKQKGRIRFVNLYTNKTYPKRDIDIWQGRSATDPCAKKLATVPFGRASDYVDVTASNDRGDWGAVVYVAGTTDKNHEVAVQNQTFLGGEQATTVVEGTPPRAGAPASAGSIQAFLETNDRGALAMPVPPPGRAALSITTALKTTLPHGSWVAGAGQSTCLRALSDTSANRATIGGTTEVRYAVEPGSLDLGLYPSKPGTCSGTPDVGPAKIDVAPGSATLVLVYGADAKHLELLVLPIAQ